MERDHTIMENKNKRERGRKVACICQALKSDHLLTNNNVQPTKDKVHTHHNGSITVSSATPPQRNTPPGFIISFLWWLIIFHSVTHGLFWSIFIKTLQTRKKWQRAHLTQFNYLL